MKVVLNQSMGKKKLWNFDCMIKIFLLINYFFEEHILWVWWNWNKHKGIYLGQYGKKFSSEINSQERGNWKRKKGVFPDSCYFYKFVWDEQLLVSNLEMYACSERCHRVTNHFLWWNLHMKSVSVWNFMGLLSTKKFYLWRDLYTRCCCIICTTKLGTAFTKNCASITLKSIRK